MALSGVNNVCKRCNQKCKQWEQIKVINCPYYELKQEVLSNEETQDNTRHPSGVSNN